MVKKWEYLNVTIREGGDGSLSVFGWRATFKTTSPSTKDIMDDIGSYGWELVGFQDSIYVFKRPLSED